MKPYSTGAPVYPGSGPLRESAERIIRFIKFNPCFILALLAIGTVVMISDWEPSGLEFDQSKPVEVAGWVSSPVSFQSRFVYFEVTPLRLSQGDKPFSISGNLGVFLARPSKVRVEPFSPPLRFGELIKFNTYLTQPTVYAAPGVLDSRRFAKLRGVPYRANLKSSLQIERKGQHESLFVKVQSPLRIYLSHFEKYCVEALDPVAGRLVLSSFLGRSFYLDPAERERAREVGVQHLFVVSGFHIAVVFAALHALLKTWGIPGRCITILSAWAYISAVGFTVPATRAGIIATVYYIALTLGVSTRSLNTLGLSALVVILASKETVFLTSFHFSYACILSIILVSYPIIRRLGACRRGLKTCWSGQVLTAQSEECALQRRTRYLTELLTAFFPRDPLPALRFMALLGYYSLSLLVTSVTIQLILLPLVLHHSNRWSFLQPLSNLLLVPLFSLILPVAFGLLLIYWTPLAFLPTFFLNLSSEVVEYLLNSLNEINRLIYVAQPSIPELLGFYWVLIILYLVLPGRARSAVLILPLLLLVLLTRTPSQVPGPLQLTMLDVGQGDSIHIRYPDGSDALVDTGGSALAHRPSLVSERVVSRYLWNQRARRLDYLLITHPEIDHRGGHKFLTRAFSVKQLFYFEPHRDYSGDRLQLSRGDSFQRSGVWHEVIHPPLDATSDNHNALSLVVLLRYGHFSALLTGDIGVSEERVLVSRLPNITLLKIAHHGSRFSTSREFLNVTNPQVAMISAGRRNAFGHPSPQVLERIREAGAFAVSTASLGSLRILTDGFGWELQHYSMNRKEFVTLLRGDSDRTGKRHEQEPRISMNPPHHGH